MSVGSKKLNDSLPLSVFMEDREQIECTVCGETFECEESLDRHQQTHYPTCQRCHVNSCDDILDRYCRECSLGRQVDKVLRYKCEKCETFFSENSQIDFHVKKECPSHIKERIDRKLLNKTPCSSEIPELIPFNHVYKCNWCEEEYLFESLLTKHENVCPMRFKTKEVIAHGKEDPLDISPRNSLDTISIQNEPVTIPLDKGLGYKCEKCEKRYSEKIQIEFHVRKECPYYIKERHDRNHTYKIVKRSYSLQKPKLNRSQLVYKYQWCEENYVSDSFLREHKKACPKRTKDNSKIDVITCAYFCPLCRARFTGEASLQRHRSKCPMRLQLKKKVGIVGEVKDEPQEDGYEIGSKNTKIDVIKDEHLCELCGQGFISETVLQRHLNECPMQIQTQEETIFLINSVKGEVEIKEEPQDEDYEIDPGTILDTKSIKTEHVDTCFEIKVEPEEVIFL